VKELGWLRQITATKIAPTTTARTNRLPAKHAKAKVWLKLQTKLKAFVLLVPELL
jgi:hypothetical protein